MWTYIDKTEVENFINKYPQLAEGFNDISLYETPDKIFLPRLFYKNFPNGLQLFETKTPFTPIPTYFKFTGKLRDEQVEIINTVIDVYQKNKYVNGIIKARPGLGKTVLSVYIAAKLGIKVCIIVDNSNLMKQWIKAFYDFTDLKESEIGIIKQKFFTIDRPVTIAMVQTLLSNIKTDMHKIFQIMDTAKFGLVFYDEVHNTSAAPKFAKASLLFRTLNILGLSATPFQTGTAEILMKNTIGEILFETKRYDLKPKYLMHYYDSGLDSKYSKVLARITDYIKKKAMYNSFIVKSKNYCDIIIDLTKLRLSEGHVVLILCFTKAQIKLISEALDNEKIPHRRYYGDEKDEIDKDTVNTMVGTYSFIGKGFDFERLSNLILATNLAGKKSLIQVIGRILRKSTQKINTKKDPVVDDLIDIGFPSMFLPDVKSKKNVINNEFIGCDIIDVKHYEE